LADELTAISQTDGEAHVDWIEAQLDEIKQMGIQNYLSTDRLTPTITSPFYR
jgi:bacterioferritin (cytochrome b1)